MTSQNGRQKITFGNLNPAPGARNRGASSLGGLSYRPRSCPRSVWRAMSRNLGPVHCLPCLIDAQAAAGGDLVVRVTRSQAGIARGEASRFLEPFATDFRLFKIREVSDLASPV